MNKNLSYKIFVIFLAISCKINYKQYGIILNSEDKHKLPNGSLVEINKTNENKKISHVTYKNQTFIIFDFTMKKFSSKLEAKKFQKKFAPYVDKYALNKKDTLPLRSEPNSYKDNIIYRIPKNSILKIISIGEITKAGYLPGKWIYILTKDGYKGYVFDYSVEIYDNIPGKIIPNSIDINTQEKILEMLKNLKYLRPYYYEKMILEKNYDIKKFKDKYGLFFTKNNSIQLSLPDIKLEYKFNKIDEVKPNGYLFKYKNPNDFIILKKNNFNIYDATIKVGNNNFKYKFILIKQDIKNIILKMKNQNKNLIKRLSSYKNLKSTNFGIIKFNEDLTFIWNKNKEKSLELPSIGNYEIAGITPDLQMSYKSAIKLISPKKEEKYFFLIDFTDSALQMILIDKIHIDNNTINNDKNKIAVILFKDKR